MNKKVIRLTESDLHRIVKESVNRILKEYDLSTKQGQIDSSWADFDDEADKIKFNQEYDKKAWNVPETDAAKYSSATRFANTNVKDRQGKLAMYALSKDPLKRAFGRKYKGTDNEVY